VKIILAEQGIYAAIIDGKVAVKLGAKDWNPGPEFKLHESGNNYAVWGVGVK